MRSILPFVAAGVMAATQVAGTACPVFDQQNNLYVLGAGTDYSLGTQDTWGSSPTPQALSNSGTRPPFTGTKAPRCHLAQAHNVVYVLGADASSPSDIWIFNVEGKSWSKQTTDVSDGPDPENQWEVLDHDTNVIYAYSKNTMYFARMEELTSASSSAIAWVNQGVSFPWGAAPDYKPAVANANNRVVFFGAPGSEVGQSYLYVVHFAYPQPEIQGYPSTTSQPSYPVSQGWATSIFDADGKEQRQVAFIPTSMAATYLVDIKVNQTLPMPGPTDKSAGSSFAGSTTAVVQLTSEGKLYYLPVSQTDIKGTGANSGAKWSSIATVSLNTPTSPPSGGGGASATGSHGTRSTTTTSPRPSGSSTSSVETGNQPDASTPFASISLVAALIALSALVI